MPPATPPRLQDGHPPRASLPLAELIALSGSEVAVSPQFRVGDALIREFNRFSPGSVGGVSPFLLLSLLGGSAHLLPKPASGVAGLNYGLDEVRFGPLPPTGSRLRLRFRLTEVLDRRPNVLLRYGVTIEVDGEPLPAATADWLILWVT